MKAHSPIMNSATADARGLDPLFLSAWAGRAKPMPGHHIDRQWLVTARELRASSHRMSTICTRNRVVPPSASSSCLAMRRFPILACAAPQACVYEDSFSCKDIILAFRARRIVNPPPSRRQAMPEAQESPRAEAATLARSICFHRARLSLVVIRGNFPCCHAWARSSLAATARPGSGFPSPI